MFCQTDNFTKGVTLFNNNEFKASQLYFEKVLISDPNYKKAREYLGDVAGYQKKWDLALSYYQELLNSNSNSANYNFKYGGALALKAQSSNKMKALTMIGDFKKHLHKAADLDKNHIEVRWALVEIYISLPKIVGGSEKKALIYANELLKLSPVDGYLALGYVAEYSDRPKDAEYNYKKAIEVGGSLHTFDKLSNLYGSRRMT